MNQPAPSGPRRSLAAMSLTRLIAIAAAIACLICGIVLLAGHLTPDQIKTWAAAGLIAAGVALGLIIFD